MCVISAGYFVNENGEKLKFCHRCQNWLVIDLGIWGRNLNEKDGLRNRCKKCRNKSQKIDYYKDHEKNKEKSRKYGKISYRRRRTKILNEYHQNKNGRKDKAKEREKRYSKDPIKRAKLNERKRKYRKLSYVKNKRNESRKRRYRTDPQYNLTEKLRARLHHALNLNNWGKTDKTLKLLGCSLLFLQNYLLEKFEIRYKYRLNWQNLVSSRDYVIDHIIPFEAFDIQLESAQKAINHWTNLEILTLSDNDKKLDILLNGERAKDMKIKYTGLEPFLGVNKLEITICEKTI